MERKALGGVETEAMAWSAGLDLGWGFLQVLVGEGLSGAYSGQRVSITSELDVMSFVAD